MAKGSLKSKKRVEKATDIISFVLVVFFSFLCLFPIYWIFRSSLMTNNQLFAAKVPFFPPEWLFSNYPKTLENFPFWLYLKNTMTFIVPSVLAGTITAIMGGYALARLRFRGKKFIFLLIIGSMFLPTMVTLIPIYIMWTSVFNLSGTYWPLILPYFCGGGAFNIYLIRQFIQTIPRELDEAATIDGAGYFRILVSIIFPAIKAAAIVVALLLFTQMWNDLIQQSLYIHDAKKFTIALGLSQFKGSLKQDYSAIMCATCMSFAPGIIFYLLGQRYFVEGIVLTGMKS